MAEVVVDLPAGYGIPTIDLETDRLPEPTMEVIAAGAVTAVNGGVGPYHLDAYNQFFSLGGWASGQASATTTLSSAAALGATSIVVTSATGLVVGTILVLKPGTANQSQHRITVVAGTTLTITPALPVAASSGEFVGTSWSDASHLTTAGYQAYWYWVLRRTRVDGTPMIVNPTKIVLLADSWGSLSTATFPAAVAVAFPSATAVVTGVSGNKSADLLARFDTDVPADADYVIFNEPGVNDAANSIDPATQAANLEALIAKCRAIGAVPILTGAVPLQLTPAQAYAQSVALLAQASSWEAPAPSVGMGDALSVLIPAARVALRNTGFGAQSLPAATTGTDNTAFGQPSQGALTTGARNTGVGAGAQQFVQSANDNTALGYRAQRLLSSGTQNTAVGGQAQDAITTGGNNTAVGQSAQRTMTTGGGNTAVGQQSQYVLLTAGFDTAVGFKAQVGVTSGSNNTAVGSHAQGEPAGVPANATTTGNRQTSVGTESGQSVATQLDDIVTIGWRAVAGDQATTALGTSANAGHARSVALGYQTATTAADQVAHGARSLHVLNVSSAPATPTGGGVLYVEAGALKYKGSSGTVTVLGPA
jgi:hypothetical protein